MTDMALKDVLGGKTLPEAIELVSAEVQRCEAAGIDPSPRVIRLGKYLHHQWRLFSGTGVANFAEDIAAKGPKEVIFHEDE